MDPSGRSPKPLFLHPNSTLFCIATLHICGSSSGSGLHAAVSWSLSGKFGLKVCLTASLALTWIHSWQKCGFDTTRGTLLISTFVALMFCQSPSLPPSPIYVALTPRLRERELQLQSDLTTASREINRLRVNIKQAGSSSSSRGGEGSSSSSRSSRPTPLSSASIAALSLRSPPEERDRQH